MISKTNQVISVAMSAALLLTNMIAPMKVYAEETSEETILEAQPEYPAEEELPAPTYVLTLPWYEDIVYMVDEGRVFVPENVSPDDKTIFLRYGPGDKVEYASVQTVAFDANGKQLGSPVRRNLIRTGDGRWYIRDYEMRF